MPIANVARVLIYACCCFLGQGVADAQSYSFTTMAGLAGVSGTTDGTNSFARFHNPAGITVDRAGNLYVAEILNHTVRKITPAGTNWVVTTIAGLAGTNGSADGTNSQARFDHPNGIAVDPNGNLFVADHYNHTVRKLAPYGTNWVVTTIAGLAGVRDHIDGTNGDARFYSPTGIALDDAGRLYVADTANFTIRHLTPIGTNWAVTTIAGFALNYGFVDGINDQARFDYPYDVRVSNAGKVYVSDWGNDAIRELTSLGQDWIVNTIAGSGAPGSTDGSGRKAKFNFPNGVAVDQFGVVYVADQDNDTIRRMTPPDRNDWNVTTIGGTTLQPGSADGTGSNARFNRPWGVAVDVAGNIYVSDFSNHTIRKGVPPWGATPRLWIQISAAENILVFWPSSATNFLLETSSTLSSAWTPLTNGIVTESENSVLTNQPNAAAAYFRLRRK